MNRRGDVPMIALVVAALFLSVVALLMFSSQGTSQQHKFVEYTSLFSEIDFNRQYVISSADIITHESALACKACSPDAFKAAFMNSAASHDTSVGLKGNFFGKIRTGDFEVQQTAAGYVLVLHDLFISAESGTNSIIEHFDLTLTVNKETGAVVKKVSSPAQAA
ncbi:hypothetical protein KW805_02660 [Candidatus Pacearchaeota archaeon]|nr:hypothetical protein [Candidatus Pacearchaeota archaeon]